MKYHLPSNVYFNIIDDKIVQQLKSSNNNSLQKKYLKLFFWQHCSARARYQSMVRTPPRSSLPQTTISREKINSNISRCRRRLLGWRENAGPCLAAWRPDASRLLFNARTQTHSHTYRPGFSNGDRSSLHRRAIIIGRRPDNACGAIFLGVYCSCWGMVLRSLGLFNLLLEKYFLWYILPVIAKQSYKKKYFS